MFNVYSIENQNFYLNNSLVSGIQNLSISYDNNINPSISIEDSNKNYFIRGPIIANIDLDYILSEEDRFINLTGRNPFSGKIEYGNNYFTFSSGYLTDYTLSYKLGEYPRVSVKALVFGEIASSSGIFNYKPTLLQNFKIGDNCYVDLNLSEANSNRLQSFNINIGIPREGVYTIGNYLPDDVITKYPINISLNFDMSMSDYTQNKITDLFNSIITKDININIKNYNTNQNLLGLNFKDLVNNQTQINYDINDEARFNLNLVTYILSGT